MTAFCAGFLGQCLVLLLQLWQGSVAGAARLPWFTAIDHREQACCRAMLDDETEMVYAGEYGERLVPMACYKHRVGCSALGLRVEVDVATRSTLKEVVQERVKLQSRSNCDACEWEGRYPSGSTIPLDDQRGGCSATGCVPLGKEEAAAVIQNGDTAEEQTIARLEQGVQTLSGTVDQLRRAALAEMAEKEEAAAARDEARVHLSTCSARANDLDAASAEFERFMAATLVGRDQHTISANETFVPAPSGPDDEPPVEEVFARASARFTEVKNMAVSFIADVKENLAKSLAEIDSLQQQVGDLGDSSTKSVERAKLAEEETQKLAADLERSMMEIQSLQHKVLDLEDSSTKSEEKAELAEEHGQRAAADLEQSMTEVDSLQQQVSHLEDSSTKSVERAKLAEEETQKLAADLERSMMEIQSLQHKVLDLEDSSTKSEEKAELAEEHGQRAAADLEQSMTEVDSLQQQVSHLEDSSTKSVERAKLAEEETQKLAADLERSMMEIQSLQHKVLDLEDSSTKSEEKAELAEEHGQRAAADLEQSMTEVDSLQQQVSHLEDSSTKSVERAKLAEEETQKLAADLERSMMEIQSLQHKVLDLEDSSTKSEEKAELAEEHGQRTAADLEQSMTEVDSLQQQVFHLEDSSTKSVERAKLAEEEKQKLAAELERSMIEIQSLQHKVLDLEDSSTKSEEEARLPQEDRQRVAADLERSLSEIDSLQHKVLDLVKSSTDSEERVKIAEEKRQKLEEKLASYDGKVPIMLIALLAVLVYKLGRPEEPNRRHRFRDRPPIRLPRTPSPERARRSPAAAAVEYAPAVDAGGSEQEAEERAAQRAATLDEARPLQERRAISAPNLAFDAEAAPWALADDAASTGPSEHHDASEEGAAPPPAAGTEHSSRPPSGLEGWAVVRWREGTIKREFLDNVAEGKGANSAELKFAEDALKQPGGPLRQGARLGVGTFGAVDILERVDAPGERFAMKRISEIRNPMIKISAVIEMAVFSRVALRPHENVLEALAMDDTQPTMPILMPMAQGDLQWFMTNNPTRVSDRLSLVADLARGAVHIHVMGIIHRDIKPENVLVFETPAGVQGKLADFGSAREIGEMCPGQMGTLGYMAHESMSETRVVGTAAHDVVGVAVVLLKVCLRDDHVCRNVFARKAFYSRDDDIGVQAIFEKRALGHNVFAELVQFEFGVARRTMVDGTFNNWLAVDKLHPAIKSPAELIEQLPSFLAANPAERESMDSLCALISWMQCDGT